jgi:hypothetical protein
VLGAPGLAETFGTVVKAVGDAFTYTAVYTAIRAGTAVLTVSIDGQEATLATSTVKIANGPLYLTKTSAFVADGDANALPTPTEMNLRVVARDTFGNRHTSPALDFRVTMVPSEALVSTGVQTLTSRMRAGANGTTYYEYFRFFERTGLYIVNVYEDTQGQGALVTGPGMPLSIRVRIEKKKIVFYVVVFSSGTTSLFLSSPLAFLSLS